MKDLIDALIAVDLPKWDHASLTVERWWGRTAIIARRSRPWGFALRRPKGDSG